MIVKCPRCGKQMEMAGNPFRPFCSERCKTVDLGNWMSGTYRIPEDEPEDVADDESRSRKDLKKEE